MLSAVSAAGVEDMANIIETVQRMGLENVMHTYEKALLSLAFHWGCVAGKTMEAAK